MADLSTDVRDALRDIPDFPKPGILFKDITPVLADAALFGRVIDWMATQHADIDVVVGMESRGFLFGTPLALKLGAAFAPARKKGKLPHTTVAQTFDLEYGTATLELHTDAIRPGQKVLVVDDLLATGGTAKATLGLVRELGGEPVGCLFLVELGFLDGRQQLGVPTASLVRY